MSGAILAQAAMMRSKGLLKDDDEDLQHIPAALTAKGRAATGTSASRKGRRALWEYPYDPALGAEQFAHAKEHIRRLADQIKEQETSVTLAQAVMDARKDVIDLVRTTILNDSVLLISDVALREDYKERFKTILDSDQLMGLHKAGLELEYRTRIERLESELRRNANDEAAREKALEARDSQMEELRNERNAALAQVQQTKKQLSQLQEQFGVLRQNYRDANERYRDHSKAATLLNNEVQSQQRIIDSQRAEMEELNSQLAEFREVLESGGAGAFGLKRSLGDLASETTGAMKRQCDTMLQMILATPGTAHMSSLTAFADSFHAAHRSRKAEEERERQVMGASTAAAVTAAADGSPPPSTATMAKKRTDNASLPTAERLELALEDGVGRDHRMAKNIRDVVARMRPTVEKFRAEATRSVLAAVDAANDAAHTTYRLQLKDAESSAASGGDRAGYVPRPAVLEPPKHHIGDLQDSMHLLLGFTIESLVASHDAEAQMIKAHNDTVARYEAQIAVLGAAMDRGVREMRQLEQLVAKANPAADDGNPNNAAASPSGSPSVGRRGSASPTGKTPTFVDENSNRNPSALTLLTAAPTSLKDAIKALKMEMHDKASMLGLDAINANRMPNTSAMNIDLARADGTNSPLPEINGDRVNRLVNRPGSGGGGRPGSGGSSGGNSPTRAGASLFVKSSAGGPTPSLFEPVTNPDAWPVASEALRNALSSAEGLLGSFGNVLGTVATQHAKSQLILRRASLAKESQALSAAQAAAKRRQSLFGGGGLGTSGGLNDPAVELTRLLIDLEKRTVVAAGGPTAVQQMSVSGSAIEAANARRRSSASSSASGFFRPRSNSQILRVFDPQTIEMLANTAKEVGHDVRNLVAKHSEDGGGGGSSSGGGKKNGGGGKNNANKSTGSDEASSMPLVPQAKHVESMSMIVLALSKLLGTSCVTLNDSMEATERLSRELDRVEVDRDRLREQLKKAGISSASAGGGGSISSSSSASMPQKKKEATMSAKDTFAAAAAAKKAEREAAAAAAAAGDSAGDPPSSTDDEGGSPRRKAGVRIFTRAVYTQTEIDFSAFNLLPNDDNEDDDETTNEPAPPVLIPALDAFKFGDDEDAAASTVKKDEPSPVGKDRKTTAAAATAKKPAGKKSTLAAASASSTNPKRPATSSKPMGKTSSAAAKTVTAGNVAASSKQAPAKSSGAAPKATSSSAAAVGRTTSSTSTNGGGGGSAAPTTIDSYEAADGTIGMLPSSADADADGGETTIPNGGAVTARPQRSSSVSGSLMITRAQHNLLMMEARRQYQEEFAARLAESRRDVSVGGTRPPSAATSRDSRRASLAVGGGAPPLPRSSRPSVAAISAAVAEGVSVTAAELEALHATIEADAAEKEALEDRLVTAEESLAAALLRAEEAEGMVRSMAEEADTVHAALVAAEDAVEEARMEKVRILESQCEMGVGCGSIATVDYQYVQTDDVDWGPPPPPLPQLQPLLYAAADGVYEDDPSGAASAEGSLRPFERGSASANLQRPILSTHTLHSYNSRPPSARTRGGGAVGPTMSTVSPMLDFTGDGPRGVGGSRPTSASTGGVYFTTSAQSMGSASSAGDQHHPRAGNGENPPRIPISNFNPNGGADGPHQYSSPHRGIGAQYGGGSSRPTSAAGGRRAGGFSDSPTRVGSPHQASLTITSSSLRSAGQYEPSASNAAAAASIHKAMPGLHEYYHGGMGGSGHHGGGGSGTVHHANGAHTHGGGGGKTPSSAGSHLLVGTVRSAVHAVTNYAITTFGGPRGNPHLHHINMYGQLGEAGSMPPSLTTTPIRIEGPSTTTTPTRERSRRSTHSENSPTGSASRRRDGSPASSQQSPTGKEVVRVATAALMFDDDAASGKLPNHSPTNAQMLANLAASGGGGGGKRPSTAGAIAIGSTSSLSGGEQPFSLMGHAGVGGGAAKRNSTTGQQVNIPGTVHKITDVNLSSHSAQLMQRPPSTGGGRPHSSASLVITSASSALGGAAGGHFGRFNPDEEAEAHGAASQSYYVSPTVMDSNVNGGGGVGGGGSRSSSSALGSSAAGRRLSSANPSTRFRPASAGGLSVPNARIYTVRDRGAFGNLPPAAGGAVAGGQHAALVATLVAQYAGGVEDGGGPAGADSRIALRPLSPPRRASDIDQLDSGRSTSTVGAPPAGGIGAGAASHRGGQFYSRRLNFLRTSPDRLRSSLDKSSGGVVTMVGLSNAKAAAAADGFNGSANSQLNTTAPQVVLAANTSSTNRQQRASSAASAAPATAAGSVSRKQLTARQQAVLSAMNTSSPAAMLVVNSGIVNTSGVPGPVPTSPDIHNSSNKAGKCFSLTPSTSAYR